jgi:hypothetical protein
MVWEINLFCNLSQSWASLHALFWCQSSPHKLFARINNILFYLFPSVRTIILRIPQYRKRFVPYIFSVDAPIDSVYSSNMHNIFFEDLPHSAYSLYIYWFIPHILSISRFIPHILSINRFIPHILSIHIDSFCILSRNNFEYHNWLIFFKKQSVNVQVNRWLTRNKVVIHSRLTKK